MRCSRRQLQGGQELLQGQVALALVFNLTSFASVLLPINTLYYRITSTVS